MNGVSWDPPLPVEWQPEWALTLGPLVTLSFEQLKALSEIFVFRVENLLRLRSHLCDGEVHTVAWGLYSSQVEEVEAAVENVGVELRAVPATRTAWDRAGNGLRHRRA